MWVRIPSLAPFLFFDIGGDVLAILTNDWHDVIGKEFEKPYYKALRQQLIEEYQTRKVYPDMHDLFNALHFTAYKDVKVVIIGQDPYHGPNQAHGLSFSVKPGVSVPPSLQNIYKELARDLGCTIPPHGYLEKWARQGVLLLNTSLSVRAGEPNSHQHLGWHQLTSEIIRSLNAHEAPIVFLLWGQNAITLGKLITNPEHLKLTAPHPSPLSAHRGFMGCSHFSKANQFLTDHHIEPIDWQI